MRSYRKYDLFFFTATILDWKPLLQPIAYKEIIIDSFRFLVEQNRVVLHGFVIMDSHIHLIWNSLYPHKKSNVQRDFLKFTAQMMKYDLISNNPNVLQQFQVAAKDRDYQFWQRNPLSVAIWTEAVLLQKLHYIHENPVSAKMVAKPFDYRYSSASFYETGIDEFGFLTHYGLDCW